MSQDSKNRSVNDYDDASKLRAALLLPCVGSEKCAKRPRHESEGKSVISSTSPMDWVLPSFDPATTEPQSMRAEVTRLQILKSYRVLDSEKELIFDRLTRIASRLFNAPIVLVSLVDLGRQWFKSSVGLDALETPRSLAFCAHTIMCKEPVMVIPDATQDFRFRENPLVTGPPNIRFYAGAALISPEGYKLGTFCVIDTKPRHTGLSDSDRGSLRDFADTAVQMLVDRRLRLERHCPDNVIALTAHDLLTPLTAVQLSLSLLKESGHHCTAHQHELIDTALLSGDMMEGICKSTLDTLREAKSDASSLLKRTASGKNVIRMKELVQNLRTIIDPIPKNVPFAISLSPTTPQVVCADDLKVFRCCLNLLMNSIERTERGSVHLTIEQSPDSTFLVFKCDDNGPEPSIEPSIFDDGQRAEELSMEAIAFHMKDLHGTFGSKSNDTAGSLPSWTFWFKIPLHVPDELVTEVSLHDGEAPGDDHDITPDGPTRSLPDPPVTDSKTKEQATKSDKSSSQAETKTRERRALIVDDSLVIRKSVGRALTKQGFSVVYAQDGVEGLELLKSTVFDLTLMDFLMPNLDGIECVKQYRDWEIKHRAFFRQYIVGISAHADTRDQNRGLEAGMDGFRPKPITVQTLREFENDERLRTLTKLIDQYEGETLFTSIAVEKRQSQIGQSAALIVSDVPTHGENTAIRKLLEDGWSITVVNDTASCTDALRERTWSLVLIDDDLPNGTTFSCIASFRDWEQDNRVNRQPNIILVCSTPIPSPLDSNSFVQPPRGFNGVLSKPISSLDLTFLIQKSQLGDVAGQFSPS